MPTAKKIEAVAELKALVGRSSIVIGAGATRAVAGGHRDRAATHPADGAVGRVARPELPAR